MWPSCAVVPNGYLMSAIFPTDKWKDTQREKWSCKYHMHWQTSHPLERQISVSTNTKGSRISCFFIGKERGLKCCLLNDIIIWKWERETQNWWLSKKFFLSHTIKSLAGSDINLYCHWYEVPEVKLLHLLAGVKPLIIKQFKQFYLIYSIPWILSLIMSY